MLRCGVLPEVVAASSKGMPASRTVGAALGPLRSAFARRVVACPASGFSLAGPHGVCGGATQHHPFSS